MPRFSVIVPAYKVQAYLPACLDSVLSQSCPDLELIVVDDGSPDACGDIADEFAGRDARVRPVHLPRNEGPGPARNAGIRRATGDYLVFLDGDDTLTPHALRAVAGRLEETGDPDVLVYGHARTHVTGETVRDPAAALLAERGPAPFALAGRPELLELLTVAWNKAVRREFAERRGLSFPPGLYEDTPWTYPVLMAAESIATLDRVCVHHRRRRRGGVPDTPGERHLDVFTQYDRVFAYVESDPELERWRPVLFRRMADHLVAVFTRPGRLPRSLRAEFARRARAHCRRYRVPGVPVPPGVRLRHALLRLGLRRTWETLRLASALLRRTRKLLAKARGTVRTAALRLHYAVQRRLPVRADRALFATEGDRGYGGDPGALEEAFRTLAPHVRTAWAAAPAHHHTVPPGTRRLAPGTAAYWTALARSRYLVHESGLDAGLVKRRGQVVVRTQPGTPLRYAGLDLRERPAAARGTGAARLLTTVDTWDHLVCADRHSTLTWERVCPGGYTTLELGRPRADVFQRATAADVARLRETLGIPEDTVALLYAPTYRDYRRTQRAGLDLERLVTLLGPRFMVLARAHPRHGGPLTTARHDRIVDVSGHPRVESLCLASDALVTDFSSLMCDYAVLDRPIVLHADEPEAFEAALGCCLDPRAFPPGPVAYDEDELIGLFTGGQWRGPRSALLRAAFRERFCPHDDGRAAERVVRRVVLGETDLPPVVPLAARRPAPPSPALSPGAAEAEGRPSPAVARAPLAAVPRPTGPRTVTESL
ncbi:CDP-glycerol glycerophosphotransferase family protein [Streptomyces sp. NPDC047725]|uniref:bifunctional glycosyltransferase/CDP-glycerol:glycerophosphate glycerophosphotransferase n=1 Tax=Streptomyces sp. NPDC047725 TaxID=3365487 RepID=UPI0037180F12